MKTNWILGTAAMALSVTAAVGAQSAPATDKPAKGDMMRTTYTGCVESLNHGSTFMLTKVDRVDAESIHGGMATMHNAEAAMKEDAGKAMPHEGKPMAGHGMEDMPSKSFALTGSANFSKHVGQKVSVTGSLSGESMGAMRHEVPTLTVEALKVIGKSCS